MKKSDAFQKESAIKKKIDEIFLKREIKYRRAIETAIYDHIEKYKEFRKLREQTLIDIEKDRIKISRRKKSAKIINKQIVLY